MSINKLKTFISKILFVPSIIISWLHMKLFPIRICSAVETCRILASGVSTSRFGDSELSFVLKEKHNLYSQKADKELVKRLREIISLQLKGNDNFQIGIPLLIYTYNNFSFKAVLFWAFYNFVYRWKLPKLLKNQVYLDAMFARNSILKVSNRKEHLLAAKSIWEGKDIAIIEGEHIKFGVNTDILSNAKSIRRLIAPSSNAFSYYEEILNEAKLLDRSTLILIILGPTATILAYDLFCEGFHAIDFGQGDITCEEIKFDPSKITSEQKYQEEIMKRIIG